MKFIQVLSCLVVFIFSWQSMADEKGPCADDGPKLCKKANFGKGGMFACLVEKKDLTSFKCKKHLEGLTRHRKDCDKEIKRFCKGKPFYCLLYPSTLSKHAKQLSHSCLVSVLVKQNVFSPCQLELKKNCANKDADLRELLSCLQNTTGLSTKCARFIKK